MRSLHCDKADVSNQPFILPILNITVVKNNKKVSFNCLYDTGSQRSYFSPQVLRNLDFNIKEVEPVTYKVNTFLGRKTKALKEVELTVLNEKNNITTSFFVDDDFGMDFKFEGFSKVLRNLANLKFKFAFTHNFSDHVQVQGLIGVDLIQYMVGAKLIECMGGAAIKFPSGIAPLGSSEAFLYPRQIAPVESENSNDFDTMVNRHSDCPSTLINFVMEPKASYPDPLAEFFDESEVERRLDKMFDVDAIGLKSDKEISNVDELQIKKFKESIVYKEGKYFVKLPWHENKINQVPSNYQVALKALDRTVKQLDPKQLTDQYFNCFFEQEKEGIIKRFEVSPKDFSKYIWIPHRPVFKTDDQCTTKIRPVFNCSLKVNGGCSLNEAAYSGINLMGDMLELTLLFRSNKYVLLGDIRKAFLMIKLISESDQNRFCFFAREGGKLIAFKYTTLIFGYNASPFILNYVLKHHANAFPADPCTEMLKNNFYVDNLIKTSNDAVELENLYKESVQRLQQGNFELRSCNTNLNTLKQKMIEDDKYVEHGQKVEKVLGYKYDTESDLMFIGSSFSDVSINTKRAVLSQTAKILILYL